MKFSSLARNKHRKGKIQTMHTVIDILLLTVQVTSLAIFLLLINKICEVLHHRFSRWFYDEQVDSKLRDA